MDNQDCSSAALNIQKISTISTEGKVWKPITCRVVYQFPRPVRVIRQQERNQENASTIQEKPLPLKYIISDETGLITMLHIPKDESDYDFIHVGQTYTITAGGSSVRPEKEGFRRIIRHNHKMELWLHDIKKIVEERSPMLEHFKIPFDFQLTELSKLAKGVAFDIMARCSWIGPEIESSKGIYRDIELLDDSLEIPIKCRLNAENAKSTFIEGDIITIFEAFVSAEGNDLVIYANQYSAVFLVSLPEWDWILSDSQREKKNRLSELVISRKRKKTGEDERSPLSPVRNENVLTDQVPVPPTTPTKVYRPFKKIKITHSPQLFKEQTLEQGSATSAGDQSVIRCDNIEYVTNSLLGSDKQKSFKVELVGLHLWSNFSLRRYLGCGKLLANGCFCSKALRVMNGNYVCYGKSCDNPTESDRIRNESERKSFYLLKNLTLQDCFGKVLPDSYNITAFNDAVEDFLQKDADLFQTDSDAVEKFESLILNKMLTVTLIISRSQQNSKDWIISISKLATMEYGSQDNAIESPALIPPINLEDIKSLLARRVPLEIKLSDNMGIVTALHDEYQIRSRPRGVAFHISSSTNRNGAEADVNTFKEIFEKLNYKVVTAMNLDQDMLQKYIEDCRRELHDLDSLILCISCHGLANTIMLSNNTLINLWTDILYKFDDKNFPEFRGKPKVVLINACQSFPTVEHKNYIPLTSRPDNLEPFHPDFLVCTSASPGYQSFRDTNIGTHFMRTLACVLMRYAYTYEFRKLLKMVQEIMLMPDESANQMPQLPVVSDFIFSKNFYFRP